MNNTIKKFGNLIRVSLGIIALVAVIMVSMSACDDGSGGGTNNNGGSGLTVPDINSLPDFPAASTPAATKASAETILTELRQSYVLDNLEEEIWDVTRENRTGNNYSFTNKSSPYGNVKVTASGTENVTATGGLNILLDIEKSIENLYNDYDYDWDAIKRLEEQRDNIQFARNDKSSGTGTVKSKGEVTRAMTNSDVTIAQGSIFEGQETVSTNITVATAGTYETFRISGTRKEKGQAVKAFTVTTPGGSVKIVINCTLEYSVSANNILYADDYDYTIEVTETKKYSGFVKVYGDNNAVLIEHQIVDEDSYDEYRRMFDQDVYERYTEALARLNSKPANIPTLSGNTWTNGLITSSNKNVWYSISVTNGQKYYLYWDDYDTNDDLLVDIQVAAYYNNGKLIFDRDWGNNYSFTASSSGTVYILVYSYWGNGTFAIAYNTTGSQPARSISSLAPSRAISPVSEKNTDSAGKYKKLMKIPRYNRMGFLLSK